MKTKFTPFSIAKRNVKNLANHFWRPRSHGRSQKKTNGAEPSPTIAKMGRRSGRWNETDRTITTTLWPWTAGGRTAITQAKTNGCPTAHGNHRGGKFFSSTLFIRRSPSPTLPQTVTTLRHRFVRVDLFPSTADRSTPIMPN